MHVSQGMSAHAVEPLTVSCTGAPPLTSQKNAGVDCVPAGNATDTLSDALYQMCEVSSSPRMNCTNRVARWFTGTFVTVVSLSLMPVDTDTYGVGFSPWSAFTE